MSPLLSPPLFAFGACVLLHFLALDLFPKLKLLDFPERYGLRRRRLPYPTGIIPVIAFLPLYAWLQWDIQSWGLMAGILLLAITSFIDDRTPLPWWIRLLVQSAVAFIIFATGSRIYTITNPLETLTSVPYFKLDSIVFLTPLGSLPLWSGLFTVVWLGLTINALNWFDGISGQVSILSTIGFFVIGFLALSDRVGQPYLALLAFILGGLALGCFLFEIPPPRVLPGDTGAMFFGLMLGVLTIYAGGKVATAFLVLGVPLIDSFLVVIQRMLRGKSPFKGSPHGEHLHHRLLEKNWSELQVIFLNVVLGTSFGILALFLSTFQKFAAALILFVIMLSLLRYTKKT